MVVYRVRRNWLHNLTIKLNLFIAGPQNESTCTNLYRPCIDKTIYGMNNCKDFTVCATKRHYFTSIYP